MGALSGRLGTITCFVMKVVQVALWKRNSDTRTIKCELNFTV
jgi:hypothetical protein